MKNRVFNLFTLFALLLSLVGSFANVTPAQAAGILVNSNTDTVANDSFCTLREAITAANSDTTSGAADGECAAGNGTDAITFAADYTITLNDQLPSVTTVITITGNGAANTIVQANAAANTATYRVFQVDAAGNLTLDSLTVRHGRCNGSCATPNNSGGGILNNGTLTVTNSTLSDNSASNGGGIMTNGPLTVTNSILSGNSVTSEGGGIYNNGSTATLTNSTLSGNSAFSQGGGISNFGTVTLTNSTLSNNSASSNGGGIINFSTLTVTNSTFSGNSATNAGGLDNYGTATLTNSTLSGNSATNAGGISNNNSATLTMTNSTISNNSATNGGGIYNQGTLNYANTIIANSTTGADCVNSGGTIGTNTNNLVEGGTCSATLSGDPALGPLADNGGPTFTHALLTSSPAIGAGLNSVCADNPGPNNLDQRGLTRPQGTNCDIGAYESNTQQEFSLVVNTNEDTDDGFCDAFVAEVTDCTLREAINYANNTGGTWTITFAANYTITLTDQLATTGQIIITGNGASNTIIQANELPNAANRRVFQVNSGSTLTLNQVTVRHGVCSGGCEVPNTTGGGISVKSGGTLTINNSLISANYAQDRGGGLHNSSGGTVTIINSTFSDNSTLNAGGAITNQGTMTISNSTVANNAATSGSSSSGGIRTVGINATLDIYNSTISGNTSNSAVEDGSNIYQDSGTLNLYNTIIANGTDGDCVAGGTIIASNTLIENNGASDCGLTDGVDGNITGSDPALGSLTGSPAYFPLNTGSPAINTGSNAVCIATPVNNQSQNSVSRPQGVNCEIGSYELPTPIRVIIPSNGTQDGWVRESTENSEMGGTVNASDTVLIVGDDASDRQYRSMLSFDTSSLPDTAIITQASLSLRINAILGGGNPLKMFNYFMADVMTGTFGAPTLAAQDFQLSPTVSAGPLGALNRGGWYYVDLKTSKTGINPAGLTQIRLRYSLGDNDNGIENVFKFYSGNYATVKLRPQLSVWYFVP